MVSQWKKRYIIVSKLVWACSVRDCYMKNKQPKPTLKTTVFAYLVDSANLEISLFLPCVQCHIK